MSRQQIRLEENCVAQQGLLRLGDYMPGPDMSDVTAAGAEAAFGNGGAVPGGGAPGGGKPGEFMVDPGWPKKGGGGAIVPNLQPTQIEECMRLYAINRMMADKGLPQYQLPPQCGGGGGGGGGGYQERVLRYGPGQYHAEALYHSGQHGTEVSVGGRGVEDLYSRFAARSLEERVAELQDQGLVAEGLVAEGQAVDDLTSPALPYTQDQSAETDYAGLDTQSAVFGAENLGPRLMGLKDSQPWLGLLGLGIVALVLLRGKV